MVSTNSYMIMVIAEIDQLFHNHLANKRLQSQEHNEKPNLQKKKKIIELVVLYKLHAFGRVTHTHSHQCAIEIIISTLFPFRPYLCGTTKKCKFSGKKQFICRSHCENVLIPAVGVAVLFSRYCFSVCVSMLV